MVTSVAWATTWDVDSVVVVFTCWWYEAPARTKGGLQVVGSLGGGMRPDSTAVGLVAYANVIAVMTHLLACETLWHAVEVT